MTSPWIGYPLALLAHYLLRWYGLPPNPVVPEPTGGANPAPAVLSGRRAFGLLFLALVPGVGFLLRRPPQRRSAAPVASTASAVPAAPRSPDRADVWKENVPGRFGVDRQCIDCDLCREIAPLHFSHNNQEGYSYVARQPATPEETARVLEALEGCPVEAIFDRGKLPAQKG
jgi:ferredoxin